MTLLVMIGIERNKIPKKNLAFLLVYSFNLGILLWKMMGTKDERNRVGGKN